MAKISDSDEKGHLAAPAAAQSARSGAHQAKTMVDQRASTEQLVQCQQMINPLQRAPASNNTGLPDRLKSGMESLSGMSLDHVKVHYNSDKPAAVQAHAYAQGSDIHLASGQERHLPHELGHVVQQAQGRVKPTGSVNGVSVNDSKSLESEASQMGDRALRSNS